MGECWDDCCQLVILYDNLIQKYILEYWNIYTLDYIQLKTTMWGKNWTEVFYYVGQNWTGSFFCGAKFDSFWFAVEAAGVRHLKKGPSRAPFLVRAVAFDRNFCWNGLFSRFLEHPKFAPPSVLGGAVDRQYILLNIDTI